VAFLQLLVAFGQTTQHQRTGPRVLLAVLEVLCWRSYRTDGVANTTARQLGRPSSRRSTARADFDQRGTLTAFGATDRIAVAVGPGQGQPYGIVKYNGADRITISRSSAITVAEASMPQH
jgi:hypothetical protein